MTQIKRGDLKNISWSLIKIQKPMTDDQPWLTYKNRQCCLIQLRAQRHLVSSSERLLNRSSDRRQMQSAVRRQTSPSRIKGDGGQSSYGLRRLVQAALASERWAPGCTHTSADRSGVGRCLGCRQHRLRLVGLVRGRRPWDDQPGCSTECPWHSRWMKQKHGEPPSELPVLILHRT